MDFLTLYENCPIILDSIHEKKLIGLVRNAFHSNVLIIYNKSQFFLKSQNIISYKEA